MVPDDDPPSGTGRSADPPGSREDAPWPPAALYDPDGYFGARGSDLSLSGALAVALVAALATTVLFGAGMWLVTENVTGTVPVDNPERPPEPICEDPPENFADDCEAPETVERRVGGLLWDAFAGLLPFLFVGALIAWPVYAAGLHVAAVLAGGDGSIRDSAAVAAWGLVPTAVSTVAGVAVVGTALVGPDFSASTPEELSVAFEEVLATFRGPEYTAALLAVGLVVAGWQTYVWGYGLDHAHDLPTRRAMVAAGTVAVAAYLVGFLL